MRAWWLRLVSCLALLVLIVTALFAAAAATAPAASAPAGQLVGLLSEVTYGQNAAYTSAFSNTGKSQTHVEFHNLIPTNGSPGGQAIFKHASCPGTLTPTEFVCKQVKLKAGQKAEVTIVWETFDTGTSSGCLADCMRNSAYWTSDSGTNSPTKSKKTFPVGPVDTSLIGAGDTAKAAAYILGACDASPTLETGQDVSVSNPLATTVCAPGFTPPGGLLPGLLGSVLELGVGDQVNPPVGALGQGSEICLAVTSCANPFTFAQPIIFTFLLHEDSFEPEDVYYSGSNWYPEPESPITQVFHDGEEVPSCDSEEEVDLDPCVESIVSDGYGTTTVVAAGSENGKWNFG